MGFAFSSGEEQQVFQKEVLLMITRFRNGGPLAAFFRDFGLQDLGLDLLGDSPWPWGEGSRGAFPALNVWEDGDNFMVEAELPGLGLGDVEVLVVGNELTIKGERKIEKKEGVSYHRQERGTGSFSRLLRLPVMIDAGKVEASFKDGVLTVRLPKAEAAKPRRIEVKSLAK
jgi:HSP20 family protein